MSIDGKKIAQRIYRECGIIKREERFLAVFLAGADEITKSFIARKKKAAKELGIEVRDYEMPGNILQDELIEKIGEVAQQKACGGIVLQLPLPSHIDPRHAADAIPEQKDVDFLSAQALDKYARKKVTLQPPAAAAIDEVLREIGPHAFNEVAVIGQGQLIGKPAARWALRAGISHIRVYDKGFDAADLKTADLVISGAGSARLFGAQDLKKGAVVVDFGYAKNADGALEGDFNPAQADEHGILYTPTPGGTGPVLVACLMRNFCIMNAK